MSIWLVAKQLYFVISSVLRTCGLYVHMHSVLKKQEGVVFSSIFYLVVDLSICGNYLKTYLRPIGVSAKGKVYILVNIRMINFNTCTKSQ